jgi:phosphatidylserine/phosphatidylglycerophosphate/cardiolipin synthase-like enzyme
MSALSVCLGPDARAAFCRAFDAAAESIDAEFFSISDPDVVESLNRAAERGVRVRVTVEGDKHRFGRTGTHEPDDDDVRGSLDRSIDVVVSRAPRPLVHGKAAVVDDAVALIATANVTPSGFWSSGEALVVDRDAADARAVGAEIGAAASGERHSKMRPPLNELFRSPFDLRVASEDLSDPKIVAWLLHRVRAGHRDRVLVGPHQSKSGKRRLLTLTAAGVDVRAPTEGYMHEKYVDAGNRLYLGSANLTHNGIDEANEVSIIADAADFTAGLAALRADFDAMWNQAARWNAR